MGGALGARSWEPGSCPTETLRVGGCCPTPHPPVLRSSSSEDYRALAPHTHSLTSGEQTSAWRHLQSTQTQEPAWGEGGPDALRQPLLLRALGQPSLR